MAVNIEELALKSIEHYAALNVRFTSIESTLIELSRKTEIAQEKFIAACDKISRMEEKLITIKADRDAIAKQVENTRADLDKLVKTVDSIAIKVKQHSDNHCDDCQNIQKIEELEDNFNAFANGNVNLKQARKLLGTQQGLLFIKFATSKYVYITAAIFIFLVGLNLYANYSTIKALATWLNIAG